jgi:hypothetical protein
MIMFAIARVSGTFSWPWCSSGVTLAPFPPRRVPPSRRRLHRPAARTGLVAAPPGGCTPSPGGAPQPRIRRRPAPPRRPRPSARHRRLPGRRRAARSAGPLRARAAPVADAHRPALLLRRSLAATAPAASGGLSFRPWMCSGRPAPGARS